MDDEGWPERQSPVLLIFVLAGLAVAGAVAVFVMLWLASLLQEMG